MNSTREHRAAGGGAGPRPGGSKSLVTCWKMAPLYAAVALATAVVFANALAGGFVWVDHVEIVQESYVIDSWADFRAAWSGPVTDMGRAAEQGSATSGYYRPVQLLFITLNHALFGKSAALHHIPNIVLHILSTLLLTAAAARLTGSRLLAGLTGFLYGVHPVHVESVTWISGSKDTLSGFFFFAAFYLYVQWAREGRHWRCGLALALFCLGLLAKEAVIVLPAVILLVEICYGGRAGRSPAARAAGVGGFGVVAAAYLGLRAAVLGALGDKTAWHGEGPLQTFLTMPGVLAEYAGKLLLPVNLTTADTTRIVRNPVDPAIAGGAAVVILLLGVMAWGFWSGARRRSGRSGGTETDAGGGAGAASGFRTAMSFGLAFFWIAMLPVLNVMPIHHIKAERFLYLPSAGFILAVAAVFAAAYGMLRRRASSRGGGRVGGGIVLAVAAAYVVFLGWSTVDRNRDWADDHTLFSRDVAGTPNYREGLTWLGRTYAEQGDAARALQCLEEAAAEDEEYTSFVNELGVLDAAGRVLMELGRYEDAAARFRELVALDPGEPIAHMNLATALANLDRLDEAMDAYAEAERLDPRNPLVYFNRGFVLYKAGDHGAARADLERALALDPRNTNVLNLLGLIRLEQGDAAEAARLFRRSLEVDAAQPRISELLAAANRIEVKQ